MNARERFIAALTYQGIDRYPFMPGAPRESTLKRWHAEGLPEGTGYMDVVRQRLGIEEEAHHPWTSPGVDLRMVPQFEEKVLDHRDGHYVLQDWMGNVVEISDEYDATYIRSARDFVTRRWLQFPVEDHASWEQMKKRYDPTEPSRLPADFAERGRTLAGRDYPAGMSVNGPFWQLREWLGFEPLCMKLLTDPDLIDEMLSFWIEYVDTMLHTTLSVCPLDYIFIHEDMAYKAHSMISPDMARRLLLPAYARWVNTIKGHGVPLVIMDSDGFIEDLAPIWIDAGIDACNPIEVAAHNDIARMRTRFGTHMAYWGGIDKRAIAAGGQAIESEVSRVCALFDCGGGLIPSCDHGVPHDISWPNFLHYCELLAERCGWGVGVTE